MGGFSIVCFHSTKKATASEWSECVDAGKLKTALAAINPHKPAGPWSVLCDNESFLGAPTCRAAHRRCKVKLWRIPPKSPDLNPVEKYWGWLRKELRRLDMQDMVDKRPVLGKMAYKERIKNLCKSRRSQRVAGNLAGGLRRVCREVVRLKGGATRS